MINFILKKQKNVQDVGYCLGNRKNDCFVSVLHLDVCNRQYLKI